MGPGEFSFFSFYNCVNYKKWFIINTEQGRSNEPIPSTFFFSDAKDNDEPVFAYKESIGRK
jgi:hypothetical protein